MRKTKKVIFIICLSFNFVEEKVLFQSTVILFALQKYSRELNKLIKNDFLDLYCLFTFSRKENNTYLRIFTLLCVKTIHNEFRSVLIWIVDINQ